MCRSDGLSVCVLSAEVVLQMAHRCTCYCGFVVLLNTVQAKSLAKNMQLTRSCVLSKHR